MLDSFWHNCSGFWAIVFVIFWGGVFFRFGIQKGSEKQAAKLSVGAWLEPSWGLVGNVLSTRVRHGAENRPNTILNDFDTFS